MRSGTTKKNVFLGNGFVKQRGCMTFLQKMINRKLVDILNFSNMQKGGIRSIEFDE